MSGNEERRRELTRLRVKKHRAITKELAADERRNIGQAEDADNDEETNRNIAPCRGIIGDSMYRTELANIEDHNQSMEAPNCGSLADTTNDNENHSDESIVSEQSSGNPNTIADRSSSACSDRSYHDDREDAEEYHNDNEVHEIRKWAIHSRIPFIHLDGLLKILRKRLLPELPKSSKALLQTYMAKYNIVEMEDSSGESGQFVYLGIAEGLRKCVNIKLHKLDETLKLQFNIDGMQIAKSSFMQVWPILCHIFYTPDIYKPFPVAIYCGASKPKAMNTYLGEFVEEMNVLSETGIVINSKRFKVSVHSFICDTPARAMLKCVKGHTGFHACERCDVEGFKSGWTTVFPSVDSEERTDETFRNKNHPEHHNPEPSTLLLLEPPIDMIEFFIIDSMHLKSGITKKIITYWVSGKLTVRLSYYQRALLSARLEYLKKYVPCEFQRKPRAVKYIAKWKATELRFFLLYCGPIVLKGILSEQLYKHFLLLHVASRILFSSELALKRNKYAKIYLRSFFSALKTYYGPKSQVINSHNLIHVADDAINMQCELSRISAFPFENTLGTVIQKCIRTKNRPLAQICRRLYEEEFVREKVVLPPEIEILQWATSETDERTELVIKRIKFKGFTLSKNDADNKVILTSGEILQICGMHCAADDKNNVTIEGFLWKIKGSIFSYPCDSKHLGMWELTNKSTSTKLSFNIISIKNKLVMLVLPAVKAQNGRVTRHYRKFVMPLLHS